MWGRAAPAPCPAPAPEGRPPAAPQGRPRERALVAAPGPPSLKSAGPGGAMAAMATPQVSAEGLGVIAGRAAPWGRAAPAPFGVPCTLWRSLHPSPAGKAPHPAPPFGGPSLGKHRSALLRSPHPSPRQESTAAQRPLESLCPLGVPPFIPRQENPVPFSAGSPRRGGCGEGLHAAPPPLAWPRPKEVGEGVGSW